MNDARPSANEKTRTPLNPLPKQRFLSVLRESEPRFDTVLPKGETHKGPSVNEFLHRFVIEKRSRRYRRRSPEYLGQ
jgi:hypothetical protein